MFFIKNFLARVNIPELYRLKTLYVTSSKAILVTHFTSWENVYRKIADISKKLQKMTFFDKNASNNY